LSFQSGAPEVNVTAHVHFNQAPTIPAFDLRIMGIVAVFRVNRTRHFAIFSQYANPKHLRTCLSRIKALAAQLAKKFKLPWAFIHHPSSL
jgi:hypothetical protein